MRFGVLGPLQAHRDDGTAVPVRPGKVQRVLAMLLARAGPPVTNLGTGRRALALRVYQTTRSSLVEQLDVEPGRSLTDLHEAILRCDPTLDLDAEPATARDEQPATTPATRPDPPAPYDQTPPMEVPADLTGFIGRVGETTRVVALLAEAARPARIVSVAGGCWQHWTARHVRLDTLSDAEALELLGTLVGPERIRRQPAPARRLVRCCGRLPLAVGLAAVATTLLRMRGLPDAQPARRDPRPEGRLGPGAGGLRAGAGNSPRARPSGVAGRHPDQRREGHERTRQAP